MEGSIWTNSLTIACEKLTVNGLGYQDKDIKREEIKENSQTDEHEEREIFTLSAIQTSLNMKPI
jgi:hypothetical protein